MNIETKYHGNVEIVEKEIIQFPNGIPGFIEEKSFVMIPFSEDGMFQILQSTNNANIAFVLTNPFFFFNDYDFKLEESAVSQLELEKQEDVRVYVILNVHENFQETTANLQGPIVINVNNNKAKQVILTGTSYQTKHKIFQQTEITK